MSVTNQENDKPCAEQALVITPADFHAMEVFANVLDETVKTSVARRDFFKELIDKIVEQNN